MIPRFKCLFYIRLRLTEKWISAGLHGNLRGPGPASSLVLVSAQDCFSTSWERVESNNRNLSNGYGFPWCKPLAAKDMDIGSNLCLPSSIFTLRGSSPRRSSHELQCGEPGPGVHCLQQPVCAPALVVDVRQFAIKFRLCTFIGDPCSPTFHCIGAGWGASLRVGPGYWPIPTYENKEEWRRNYLGDTLLLTR